MNRQTPHATPARTVYRASRSRALSSGDRQKQDLRDFMIGQDWGSPPWSGSNPDNPEILKILLLTFPRRKLGARQLPHIPNRGSNS